MTTQNTKFERAYTALFYLRSADTKHMNDCELVWDAAFRAGRIVQRENDAMNYEARIKELDDLIDDTYKMNLGRDYMHLPLPEAVALRIRELEANRDILINENQIKAEALREAAVEAERETWSSGFGITLRHMAWELEK